MRPRKGEKRCLLVISQHVANICKRKIGGGDGGMKREITSHPTPSLYNYSNVTHMGRPPWQKKEEKGGGRKGVPCSGTSLILPPAEVWKDAYDERLPSKCSSGAC